MREPLKLQLTAAPLRLPVGLNELRAQLRLDDDQVAEDAVLLANLRTASDMCESYTGRALITQTWTLFLDSWPGGAADETLREGWHEGCDKNFPQVAVILPRPPLQSIVHVKTVAEDDTQVLWPASAYFADTAGLPGRLTPRSGQGFPAVGRRTSGIEIRFTAGHGDAPGDVPSLLRQGIVQLAAYLFENRGDADTQPVLQVSGAASLWRSLIVTRF